MGSAPFAAAVQQQGTAASGHGAPRLGSCAPPIGSFLRPPFPTSTALLRNVPRVGEIMRNYQTAGGHVAPSAHPVVHRYEGPRGMDTPHGIQVPDKQTARIGAGGTSAAHVSPPETHVWASSSANPLEAVPGTYVGVQPELRD